MTENAIKNDEGVRGKWARHKESNGDREWQWKVTRYVRNNGECNEGWVIRIMTWY